MTHTNKGINETLPLSDIRNRSSPNEIIKNITKMNTNLEHKSASKPVR